MLKLDIPSSVFPPQRPNAEEDAKTQGQRPSKSNKPNMNTSKRRTSSRTSAHDAYDTGAQEFADDDIDDSDLLQLANGDAGFTNIDDIGEADLSSPYSTSTQKRLRETKFAAVEELQPTRLENGKWACNHTCKNKRTCKHLCCREGLDRPPRPSVKKAAAKEQAELGQASNKLRTSAAETKSQTKLDLSMVPKMKRQGPAMSNIEHVDLTDREGPSAATYRHSKGRENIHSVHSAFGKTEGAARAAARTPKLSYSQSNMPTVSSFKRPVIERPSYFSSDYATESRRSVDLPATLGAESQLDVMSPEAPEEAADFDDYLGDDTYFLQAEDSTAAGHLEEDKMQLYTPSRDSGRNEVTIDEMDFAINSKISPRGFESVSQRLTPVHSSAHFTNSNERKSLFVTDTSSPYTINDKFNPGESSSKRQKLEVAGQENELRTGRTGLPEKNTESVPSPRHRDKESPTQDPEKENVAGPLMTEDIDPWLLQEFGDYVEFI